MEEVIRGLSRKEFEMLKLVKPHLLRRWGLLDKGQRPGACPECGAPLSYEGGCCVCHSCGYAECG